MTTDWTPPTDPESNPRRYLYGEPRKFRLWRRWYLVDESNGFVHGPFPTRLHLWNRKVTIALAGAWSREDYKTIRESHFKKEAT